MTRKLKLVDSLCRTRKRVRDVAAGRASEAEDRRAAAERDVVQAKNELDVHLARAGERFGASQNGESLLTFDRERLLLEDFLRERTAKTKELATETAHAQTELARKTRDLKTSEKIQSDLRAQETDRMDRDEQRAADDLSGARRSVE